MSPRIVTLLAGLGGCCLLLTACETPLDRAFGLSQGEHLALSIENPESGADDLEGPRTDGPSTDSALGKHRDIESTIDQGEPPSVINVDIGS